MRTTLVIDDQIYRQVKLVAAQDNSTISSVVEEALRSLIERRTACPATPNRPMPLAQSAGWVKPGVDIYDSRQLTEILDEGRDRDVLR